MNQINETNQVLKETKNKKVVLVIGGGFAGLNAAKTLAKNKQVQVILIDSQNFHLFQPLLYQVATAGLSPSDIAVSIRAQFSKKPNVNVHWSKADFIDLKNKKVHVTSASEVSNESRELKYDYLVVACGARHSYFGKPDWEAYAPGLKKLEQATELRRRLLTAFELAENESDPEKKQSLLNFVVVGGGPTGVELAGAIADISKTVMVKDYKTFDSSSAKIFLIEAGPRILQAFDPSLSEKAKRDLEKLGVEVRLNTRVENISSDTVFTSEEDISTICVFWAAGVEATKIKFEPSQTLDRVGRVEVTSNLSLSDFPEVYVIGDMALVKTKDGGAVPGLAPAAIQEGKFVAEEIKRSLKNQKSKNFEYNDKGIMATIGKRKAILQYGKFRLTGTIAWLAWLVVHLFYLIGFKNRFTVLANWAWSYMLSKRGARLITSRDWKNNN